MEINNFKQRLKDKKIRFEQASQPGSIRVFEHQYDPNTGERLEDRIGDVALEDVRQQRANIIKYADDQIKNVETTRDKQLECIDDVIGAFDAYLKKNGQKEKASDA